MPTELTPYEQFQLEQYGDILEKKTYQESEEFENGFEQRSRNEEWTDDQHFYSLTEQAF